MSKEQKPPLTPSQVKRQLINAYLPYELYAVATMRYYAQLQDAGQLDVVGQIMYTEGVDEAAAVERCLGLLHQLNEQRAKFVQCNAELLTRDPRLDFLNDHLKNN